MQCRLSESTLRRQNGYRLAAPRLASAKHPIAAEEWQFEDSKVREGLNGPDPVLMNKQAGFVNRLMDSYFRMEIGGWENLPQQASLSFQLLPILFQPRTIKHIAHQRVTNCR